MTKRRSSSNKKQHTKKAEQHTPPSTDLLDDNDLITSDLDPMEAYPSTNQSANTSGMKTGTGASPRLQNTTVCVPIVYGSIAFFLGKKADEYHTHRWTLYVRAPNGEDLSTGISKVVFQLHPSFPQPVRELTAPPFEVTEKGWGEFEATIRIVWRDPGEKATVLTHGIKLYPPGLTQITPATTSKEPVVHEFYDEVVFTDPTEAFHRQLMRSSVLPRIQSHEPTVQENFPTYADEEDFKALLAAQKFLEDELRNVKDRIMKADMAREEVDEALRAVATTKATSSSHGGGGKSGSSGKSGGSGGKTKSSGGGGSSSKKSKASH